MNLLGEMLIDYVKMSRARMCMEIVEETLVGDSREEIYVLRLIREMGGGGKDNRDD